MAKISHHPMSHSLRNHNPDKLDGPIREPVNHFDKGYVSDEDMMGGEYPEKNYRGNEYLKLQDKYLKSDKAKLARSKTPKVF